jgi:hypothetical protein
LHGEEYRSVKRIDSGDGLTEPEARNLAVWVVYDPQFISTQQKVDTWFTVLSLMCSMLHLTAVDIHLTAALQKKRCHAQSEPVLMLAATTVWLWSVNTTSTWTAMPIWITHTLSAFWLSRTGMCIFLEMCYSLVLYSNFFLLDFILLSSAYWIKQNRCQNLTLEDEGRCILWNMKSDSG